MISIAVSLSIGALIMLFDGMSRYNTRDQFSTSGTAAPGAFDIPPRFFTSQRGYLASFLLYIMAMELIYLIPAIVIPIALENVDVLKRSAEAARDVGWGEELLALTSEVTFPIIWALLLAGALRYLPWINHIEPQIRRMCHDIAAIPHFVHEIARRLYSANINMEAAFPNGYNDDLLFVSAEDFNLHPSSEERAWARLSYFMRELEELYSELGNLTALKFGAHFSEEYENSASEFRSLTYRMARFLDEREGGAQGRVSSLGADHRLKSDLRRAAGRAALLFVVLLNLKFRDQQEIGHQLQNFGFETDYIRARAEVGPDAAVTVLALAAILFVICPITAVLVEIGLRELIGPGSETIEYPDKILQVDSANMITRAAVLLLSTLFILIVLALVNLTLARRLAGIDPQEMLSGKWLSRPFGKYAQASMVTALVTNGAMILFVYMMIRSPFSGAFPIDRIDIVLIALWGVPFFVMSLLLHVFAHNRGHSVQQVLLEALICGIVWSGMVLVIGYLFFSGLREIGDMKVDHPQALGAAVYYALYSFLIGTAFTATLFYVSKSVRAAENLMEQEEIDLDAQELLAPSA